MRGLDAHVLRVVFSKAEYVGRWVLLDFLALECLMDCDCPVQPGSQTTHSELGAVFSGREWVLGLSTGGNSDPGVVCPGKKDCQQRRAAAFLGSCDQALPCGCALEPHWELSRGRPWLGWGLCMDPKSSPIGAAAGFSVSCAS